MTELKLDSRRHNPLRVKAEAWEIFDRCVRQDESLHFALDALRIVALADISSNLYKINCTLGGRRIGRGQKEPKGHKKARKIVGDAVDECGNLKVPPGAIGAMREGSRDEG